MDNVLQPAPLQLLPDPVGHVETGCLQGLDEDGALEDSGHVDGDAGNGDDGDSIQSHKKHTA